MLNRVVENTRSFKPITFEESVIFLIIIHIEIGTNYHNENFALKETNASVNSSWPYPSPPREIAGHLPVLSVTGMGL